MKAIVIGLGSMGKRRARLLKEFNEIEQVIGFDSQGKRRNMAKEELGIVTVSSLDEACELFHPDLAFVSTSPLSHAQIINVCLKNGLHVFSEINLIDDQYDENIKLAKRNALALFLSSTFLYRHEIQYIKKSVNECGCKISYMYHVGQYLPDWHPWENYKDYFVGDKKTNGCRELMSIELPWIIDVFGNVKAVKSINRKVSSLSVDFSDTYQLMIEHDNGNSGLVLVDVVSRKAVRKLEVSGENLYMTWGGTPKSLYQYDIQNKENKLITLYEEINQSPDYEEFIIENAYKSEIEEFIGVVDGTIDKAKYSFEKDLETLSLIDKIERGDQL